MVAFPAPASVLVPMVIALLRTLILQGLETQAIRLVASLAVLSFSIKRLLLVVS